MFGEKRLVDPAFRGYRCLGDLEFDHRAPFLSQG